MDMTLLIGSGLDEELCTNRSISAQINCETRELHAELNHLVLARLPRALPPHADDPKTYALGIQRFALVYTLFEAVWTDIVKLQPLEASQTMDHRVFSILRHLYMPELLRSERVRIDLSYLLEQPVEVVDEQLSSLEGRITHEYIKHIEQICALKPHVLVAYAWVMYMALFSGGRWVRAQLLAAYQSSWNTYQLDGVYVNSDSETLPGLAFWYFPGNENGEDIKAEFKARLLDVERLLSPEQREDIVDEAGQIFIYSARLVEELDGIIAAQPQRSSHHVATSWPRLVLRHLLPLGMIELMEVLVQWINGRSWYARVMIFGAARGRIDSEDKIK